MLIVMLVVGAKGRGSWLNGSGSLITLQTWSPEDGLNKIKLDPKKRSVDRFGPSQSQLQQSSHPAPSYISL